ncbi:inter-alpha-trypsin inhibitor heavy chain H3-like isoform X2 [Anoplophora glabripennis]|uniref:inter-alpha-trypsin inhibitor heavy chain H3-like isoform X2 n=1 Tax=Anoplophora glabripennis TaxID=217634 RepID=UPI00087595F6|nr:inter-alpha-trypsin inhibitor heavy chain H3-like isoform X2 [Anoplophora glabripennis]
MADEEQEMHSNISNLNFLLNEKALQSFEKENNVVFSPLPLHTFLLLLSQDQTYCYNRNFISTLRLYKNHDLCIKYYKDFISSFHTLDNGIFSLTRKLLIKDNYLLHDDFKNIINNFNYEIEAVDFNEKDTAAKLIDSWFGNKTHSLIKGLSDKSLNDNTHLALLDAVHFKGKWDRMFNLEPSPRMFHLSEMDSIETQMLKTTGEFYYKSDEDMAVTALELPLTSEEFSVIVILPDKSKTQDAINLSWYFPGLLENMTKENIEVLLPKFKIEQLLNCRNIFTNMYLKEEFEDNVFFFDMLQSEFLKFAQIDEKGFISVDEKGVEAASGLAVTMVPAEFNKEIISPDGLKMSEMSIKTVISNRFAKTLVTCKVQNNDKSAKEATFTVVLPETAFITEFVMEMDGKSYKSYIKGVEEARSVYDEALARGKSAGIVEADARDSTQFNVSVNMEPQSIAVFLLTYEEMLQRIHDQYELVLNICPGRIVDNLSVEVNINESRALKFVRTPPLRSGKEMKKIMDPFLVPSSDIKTNANSSVVKFSADVQQQQKIACYLGTPFSDGFTGQFVVQYDVERDPKNGEILLQDGYFVHFFAPNDLDPLRKHVVFLLDTSSSMTGRKLDQLKDAMMSILSDIRKGDLISIIEFNQDVIVWDIESEKSKVIFCTDFNNFDEPFGALGELSLPSPLLADEVTIGKAKNVVRRMPGQGSTFMIGGLEVALYMIKIGQEKIIDKSSKYQPIMVFLTDGQPNIGCGSTDRITHMVTKLNLRHNNVPIFSLSFGEGADKSFLRELSLKNFGFSRHIYEASDASLQLQSFYKQISSPLLTDIKFKYESDVTEVTRSHFPIYFRGGELVVSGKCKGCQLRNDINGCGPRGYLNLGSIVRNPVTSLERLWAYLTVKQLLEERNTVDNKEELTKRAVDLSLKYSFVTEVTSLVVVKPDETCDTNPPLDVSEDLSCNFRSLLVKRKTSKWKTEPEEEITECCEEIEDIQPEEPKKLEFTADHPFFVALALKRGDKKILLFVGWIQKPSY